MGKWRKIGAAALGIMATTEISAAISRFEERKRLFAAAKARAIELGRTFVVVGDPDAGVHTRMIRAYGCGDLCLDLTGCPSCPIAHAADLTRGPIAAVPANSAVVFVSCVLEYTDDPQAAWQEILRMAGSPENAFNVNVQPWTATAVLYDSAQFLIGGTEHDPTFQPMSAPRILAWTTAISASLILLMADD